MIADILPKIAEQGQKKSNRFGLWPSMAGPERCIRQIVYQALGYPKQPFPGRAIMIFDLSTFLEEITMDWIRKSTFQVHSEQMRVHPKPPIQPGYLDFIVRDVLGKDIVTEHKAINGYTFNRYWGGEYPKDYLTQTAIYTEAIQRELDPEIKDCILLIMNKNNVQYMEYLCHYEWDTLTVMSKTLSTGETEKLNYKFEGIVQNACDKFDQVKDYVNKKTLPKRPYSLDDWQCQYCGFQEECWKNYEAEFKELKTDEMLPNEVADMVRYYKELGGQETDIKKEKQDLRKQIIDAMKANDTRQATAGEYILKRNLITTEKVDKSLLSTAALQAATVKGFQERLSISKRK